VTCAKPCAGAFREDLYYRLHVLPLHLPALRERPEDIRCSSRPSRSVSRAVWQAGTGAVGRSHGASAGLSLAGNVRELQNVIERAVILGRNGSFEPDRYLGEVTRTPAASPPKPTAPAFSPSTICAASSVTTSSGRSTSATGRSPATAARPGCSA